MTDKGPVISGLKRFRSGLRRAFPSVAVFFKALGLVYSGRSMLRQRGYIESARTKRPVRRDGSPLPWMNYHIIQFLEDRLADDLSLFEYGSGNSTCFYATFVKHVTSLEEDEDWYAYVKETMPENVDLILFEPDRHGVYCEFAANQDQKYDVVVVDGSERVACIKHTPPALTERGVIILDDSQYPPHEEAINFLLDAGFRKLDFEGLKPNSIRAYRSTIFYRSENCLGI